MSVSFPRRMSGAVLVALLAVVAAPASTRARQAPTPATGVSFVKFAEPDAREWLTYLSSDALQGRAVFTEGYGMAAAYIADHLREWGLKPLGDDGTYFESVKRKTYRVTRNSSVTVEANGTTRTFVNGDHVTFPTQSGGRQTLALARVAFAGYGAVAPEAKPAENDLAGQDVHGALVLLLPGTPSALAGVAVPRGRATRATHIVDTLGAAGVITFAPAPASAPVTPAPPPATPPAGGRGGRGAGGANASTFTTVRRVDGITPPKFTADETFYEFLLGGSVVPFTELRAKAERGEPLPAFSLPNVKVVINIDNTYDVQTTELTENVVGLVEGTDARLRDTYVIFGAHLDHVGYSTGDQAKGRVNTPIAEDRIWNGADDDGSGSTALLLIAKALAKGPKPRRSVVLIWHAGEEQGLLGSQYMADFPVVPLAQVQAELNIDMIGRNRDNNPDEQNTVYVIGADRISTDLHNLIVQTNRTMPEPLKLDYEFNDPADPNSFYTRSDHYSYASKGIPIAFFFTGEHPDYHANTDTVDKILFPKLLRVAQMIYQAGFSLANSDKALTRDNLGPRSGRGFSGTLAK